jgi:hypothetical protein
VLDFTSCDRRRPLPHNHLELRLGNAAHTNRVNASSRQREY